MLTGHAQLEEPRDPVRDERAEVEWYLWNAGVGPGPAGFSAWSNQGALDRLHEGFPKRDRVEPRFLPTKDALPDTFTTDVLPGVKVHVLGPPRNLGVMANNTFANERGTWAIGLYRSESDAFGDDSGHDFQSAVTGRVTCLAWYDEASGGRDLLHFGGSYSARGTKNDQVRFRARPEIRIGSTEFHVVKPCARCVLTTVDQVTGVKTDKEPLKTLSSYRNFDGKVLFGQNLIAETTGGMVNAGDEVVVVERK